MTQDQDERIGDLLRQDAPSARDPMFRLSVLERRERKRFRQHSLVLASIAVALASASWIGVSAGGETAETTIALVCIVALAVAYILYQPVVTRLLQRFGF